MKTYCFEQSHIEVSYKGVSVVHNFNMSRVSVLHIVLLYSLLYTTAHLQVPLIPKTDIN